MNFSEWSHLIFQKAFQNISTKVFSHLRTNDEGWYWQLDFSSKLTICFDGFVYYLICMRKLKPSALLHSTIIIHMETSMSRRFKYIMHNVQTQDSFQQPYLPSHTWKTFSCSHPFIRGMFGQMALVGPSHLSLK
jgi:hypothetical protein